MADQIEIVIPKDRVLEGSGFTATAYFRIRSTAAADTPASIRYRIDCLTTGNVIAAWASVSVASSVAIALTGTHNAIQDQSNARERKILTVESDTGAADQCRGQAIWTVGNLQGVT